MKKLLAGLLLLGSTLPAFAHHGGPHYAPIRHGHHHHRHWHPHHGWVAPLVIGGAVTYALTRPAPVIIQEPPVIVEQPVVDAVPGTNCTPWREIQQPDGTIIRERTCRQ